MSSVEVPSPAFFISHGKDQSLLENKGKPGVFYDWLGNYLKNELKPRAIVVVSPLWEANSRSDNHDANIDNSEKPKLVDTFNNEQTWNHKGSPEIAEQIQNLLINKGIKPTVQEYSNDYAVWGPLMRAFGPNPNIPIIEVSTLGRPDMEWNFKLGSALLSLRDGNIVIIGSGNAVYDVTKSKQSTPQFVFDFDKHLDTVACKLGREEVYYEAIKLDKHPLFKDCHPHIPCQLAPFIVALGAAGGDAGVKLSENFDSCISWSSYGFGLPKDIVLPNYDNAQ